MAGASRCNHITGPHAARPYISLPALSTEGRASRPPPLPRVLLYVLYIIKPAHSCPAPTRGSSGRALPRATNNARGPFDTRAAAGERCCVRGDKLFRARRSRKSAADYWANESERERSTRHLLLIFSHLPRRLRARRRRAPEPKWPPKLAFPVHSVREALFFFSFFSSSCCFFVVRFSPFSKNARTLFGRTTHRLPHFLLPAAFRTPIRSRVAPRLFSNCLYTFFLFYSPLSFLFLPLPTLRAHARLRSHFLCVYF